MQTTYTIWAHKTIPGAFGYTVETEDTLVHQGRVPGASGAQRMTFDEATAYAQALVAELTAPPPSPDPAPAA